MSDTFLTPRNKALALAGAVVLFAVIAANGLKSGSADEVPEDSEVVTVNDEAPKRAAAPAPVVAGWADADSSADWDQSGSDVGWSERSSSSDNSEIEIGNAGPDQAGGSPSGRARASGSSGGNPAISSGAARNAPKINAPGSNNRGGGSLTVE